MREVNVWGNARDKMEVCERNHPFQPDRRPRDRARHHDRLRSIGVAAPPLSPRPRPPAPPPPPAPPAPAPPAKGGGEWAGKRKSQTGEGGRGRARAGWGGGATPID